LEAEESGGEEDDSNNTSTQSEYESESSDAGTSNHANEVDKVKYLYIYTQNDNYESKIKRVTEEILQKIVTKYEKSIVFGINSHAFKIWCDNPFDDIKIQLFNYTLYMCTSNLLCKKSVKQINESIIESKKRHTNGCFYNISENGRLLLSGIFYMCNYQIRLEMSKVFSSLNMICPLDEIMHTTFAAFEHYVSNITNSTKTSSGPNSILLLFNKWKTHFDEAYLNKSNTD
jgi:hypothetical protein